MGIRATGTVAYREGWVILTQPAFQRVAVRDKTLAAAARDIPAPDMLVLRTMERATGTREEAANLGMADMLRRADMQSAISDTVAPSMTLKRTLERSAKELRRQ
jgi:hypothetical protein